MELFRSKKRDTEQASLGDVPASLQKKQRARTRSVDSLLDINPETRLSASDGSESESENDDVFKASKRQKMFAKKSIKREKQKEKEYRKNVEKNMISMDDYLKKQSEFKMWLYEEKMKTASEITSPKLKTFFKQFVRLWNRRKLSTKYYRCSSLPDSPAPLTPRSCNFLADDKSAQPLTLEPVPEVGPVKEPPKSPFVTFGKTPPKVLRSKKLQLFPTSHDVCLISVVPLGSPQLPRAAPSSEGSQYHVPSVEPVKDRQKKTSGSDESTPLPYKVSVYPWAVNQDSRTNESLEICSTSTPPGKNNQSEDNDLWPRPPTQEELAGTERSRINDSPLIPPPPPPRSESLLSDSKLVSPIPLSANYADPYDKLSEKLPRSRLVSDYQIPLDCMKTVNSRTTPDNPGLVLKTFSSHNDEPDTSLYQKPIQEKRLSKEELEELYAKPMKRQKKSQPENEIKRSEDKPTSDLYSEIMDHLEKKQDTDNVATSKNQAIDPDYETIDECLAKIKDFPKDGKISPEKKCSKPIIRQKPVDVKKKPFCEAVSSAGRKTVLAASSDKIYETYLSLGRNVNPFKNKKTAADPLMQGELPSNMKQKCRSQPDISFSDALQVYDAVNIKVASNSPAAGKPQPVLSSFKPIDTKFYRIGMQKSDNQSSPLSVCQRAKSFEDGLRDISTPGTPTIMATPSFESLCAVTPLSMKSGSSQSLPSHCNSTDSLNNTDSSLSMSSSSSMSHGQENQSGSLQSLLSEKSLSPVMEEDENTPKVAGQVRKIGHVTPEQVKCLNDGRESVPHTDPFLMTPGKISGGIDLSVYLLKPLRQQEGSTEQGTDSGNRGISVSQSDNSDIQSKLSQESHIRSKLFDKQSKLAIKETLSGVRTQMDQPRISTKKDAERRHTVQTVHEIKTVPAGPKKGVMPLSVPNIGVAVKNKKLETFSTRKVVTPEKHLAEISNEEIHREYGEGTRVVREGKEQYLETDLDAVVMEKSKHPLKKSKSHSGFESSSSTVVTEIW